MHEEITTRSSSSVKQFSNQQDIVSCPSMHQNDTVTVSIIHQPETSSQMNNHHHYITSADDINNTQVITNIVSSHTKIIVSNELPIVKNSTNNEVINSNDLMNESNNILTLPVMEECDTAENSSQQQMQHNIDLDLELKDSTTSNNDDEVSQEEKGESFFFFSTFTAKYIF
jgi:hypothetical protein